MYAPFIITVSTTPQKLTFITESDVSNPGAATFAAHIGYALEFDVGANDIYCGPDNTVSATGNSYNLMPSGTPGSLGRKYAAGSHVELSLNKEDVIYVVTASGTSVCNGSAVGI